MFDPWSFLELDPHQATEKDVRSAYARLLKKYRPNEDLEGFQRLRRAYEAALGDLRNREVGGDEEVERSRGSLFAPQSSSGDSSLGRGDEKPPQSTTTPDIGPLEVAESPFPDAVRAAMAELAQTLTKGWGLRARRSFRRSWQVFRRSGLTVKSRARAWEDVAQGELPRLLPVVHIGALLEQWEGGEWKFTLGLLKDEAGPQEISIVQRLGRRLVQCRSLIADFDGAEVAMRLAGMVAIDNPSLARVLVNSAYAHFPTQERDRAVFYVDARERIASLMEYVPWRQRHFWISVFRNPGASVDWLQPRHQYRMKLLLRSMSASWEGWRILALIVPQETWPEGPVEWKIEKWWRKCKEIALHWWTGTGIHLAHWLWRLGLVRLLRRFFRFTVVEMPRSTLLGFLVRVCILFAAMVSVPVVLSIFWMWHADRAPMVNINIDPHHHMSSYSPVSSAGGKPGEGKERPAVQP